MLHHFSNLISPLIKLLIQRRLSKGLEEADRLSERYGQSSFQRPPGKVVWIHAASVGEVMSIVPFVERYTQEFPDHSILLTTTTVTGRMIAQQRLAGACIHQYAPFDVGAWVTCFLNHWTPCLCVLVESELWPNIIQQVHHRQIPLVLLNARLSDRSYRRWKKVKFAVRFMLSRFSVCLAQSPSVAERLIVLGAKNVQTIPNLKFSTQQLPVVEKEHQEWVAKLGGRPLWVAASTHEGEDAMVLLAHARLKQEFPNLLTIIIPRHPARAEGVKKLCLNNGYGAMCKSENSIGLPCEILIVDSIGELGLFFSLAKIVLMGGSFVPVGGHNPIEPALLGCAVIWGPHMHNFKDVCCVLGESCIAVTDQDAIVPIVTDLLQNPEKVHLLGDSAQNAVLAQAKGLGDIVRTVGGYADGI
ncbi:MAG: 3-deoxy-D-manno-octulosonic acid transferase [Alphaproteobacteria bacterium]|nr:3-deoxy-D-manno-octulosonic acid transferase [Alphaproteobacteria bacterium]